MASATPSEGTETGHAENKSTVQSPSMYPQNINIESHTARCIYSLRLSR